MSLYYINPIVWNTNGYQRPSGVNFTSGYPKEHGFGHEEWNNSPLLAIEEKGEKFRVFHTEGLGNELIDDYPEDIFLLMIASHDRGQYLVGVAGGAGPGALGCVWRVCFPSGRAGRCVAPGGLPAPARRGDCGEGAAPCTEGGVSGGREPLAGPRRRRVLRGGSREAMEARRRRVLLVTLWRQSRGGQEGPPPRRPRCLAPPKSGAASAMSVPGTAPSAAVGWPAAPVTRPPPFFPPNCRGRGQDDVVVPTQDSGLIHKAAQQPDVFSSWPEASVKNRVPRPSPATRPRPPARS